MYVKFLNVGLVFEGGPFTVALLAKKTENKLSGAKIGVTFQINSAGWR
jgi:hypothetical protein